MNIETDSILSDLDRVAAAARNIKHALKLKRKAAKALATGMIHADRHAAVVADLHRIVAEEIEAANEHGLGLASIHDLNDSAAARNIAAAILS
jgi:LDH2 family malate/lactate/ureidoglycolate dehydrogenase